MKYSFNDLISIMEKLRGLGGCPWDAKQTHQSIKKCMIEETYEVVEALDTGNMKDVYDELGDLLLQVVFHAQIAKENEDFDINDVTNAICAKLIRRHPHVFSDEKIQTADEVINRWDEIKKVERKQKLTSETLESVAVCLPSLMRAQKIQSKASKTGFDWPDVNGALDKIHEETSELEEAIKKGTNIEEELGDLLFSVVNVSRFIGVDSEEALYKSINKFISRFSKMETMAKEKGEQLSNMSLSQMNNFWNEIKKN